MASPVDVNVNPSSSTQAASGAQSGVSGITFAFGGNPNLALLNSGTGTTKTLLYVGAGVGALVLAWLFFRRRS